MDFPAPNPKNLVGVTSCDGVEIKIYAFPRSKMPDCYGAAIADFGQPAYVLIDREMMKDKKKLHKLLTHEFIHIVEALFYREFLKPAPVDCTHAATIFGERIPEMFENLRFQTSARERRNGSPAKRVRRSK